LASPLTIMVISYSKKFIFVHIFKTAGTSVTKALERHSFKPQSMRPRNWKTLLSTPKIQLLRREMHKHATALEIKQELGDATYNSFFKFSFVRNPWDWLVSLYHYILENPENDGHEATCAMGSFSKFVESRLNSTKTQSSFLLDQNGRQIVDFIGRFECLDYDFEILNKRLNLDSSLPHINQSLRTSYKYYYDSATRHIVERVYAEDIERFGYSF
jgi:hypothetical protein